MNDNLFKQTLFSLLMQMYREYLEEYKNETKAKIAVNKILNEVSENMSLRKDLFTALKKITKDYKDTEDVILKRKLYDKLETLNKAIIIMEETNNAE